MKKNIIVVLGACLIVAGASCGKKSDAGAGTNGGTMATQGNAAEAKASYDDPVLAQLTRDVKRWIVMTKKVPANFEDFVAKAKVTVPPPPAGKKYALSAEMRVILVNQ